MIIIKQKEKMIERRKKGYMYNRTREKEDLSVLFYMRMRKSKLSLSLSCNRFSSIYWYYWKQNARRPSFSFSFEIKQPRWLIIIIV